MTDPDGKNVIYCLVFNYCHFPIRPENYVQFMRLLEMNYAVKTVSIQENKTIKNLKFQFRRDEAQHETVAYKADLSLADLVHLNEIHAICIPGGAGTRQLISSSADWSGALKQVIDKSKWVVTEALGSLLLAATGVIEGKKAVITRAGLQEARSRYPTVKWETGPVFRPRGKIIHDGKFITADNLGRTSPITEFDISTKCAEFFRTLTEKGEEPAEIAPASQSVPVVENMETSSGISDQKVAELVTSIKQEREDTRIIRIAEDFALRLACESYVEDCNSIIAVLLEHNPDALNFLVKRGLEMIWHTVGPRPSTPYSAPSEQDLVGMEEEQRYYDLQERKTLVITNLNSTPLDQLAPDQVGALARAFAAIQHLEERKLIKRTNLGGGAYASSWDEGPITMPTEQEERRGLELFRNYMSRRDEDDQPVQMKRVCVYANIALKYGFEEDGMRWLNIYLEDIRKNFDWIGISSLANGRYTSIKLGQGALRTLTGSTPGMASGAARSLIAALRERWQKGEARPFTHLSWSELLHRTDDTLTSARKRDNVDLSEKEPYLHAPATEEAIFSAEARLGITLPKEYKDFLRLSNGTGPPQHDGLEPPLAPVEEIGWDEDTPRWASLRVEPLPRVNGPVWSDLPLLKRALRVSLDGDEAYVYLIEPALVAKLPGMEKAEEEGRWMASTWAAWRADHMPFEGFRDYMERLVPRG